MFCILYLHFFVWHYRLIDTLQAFVDTHGISLGSKYFDQLGEVELLNNQAVAVWKHIVVYQDRQSRGM